MRIVCNLVPIVAEHFESPVVAEVETSLIPELTDLELNVTSDYYSSFRRSRVPSYRVSAIEYLQSKDDSKWGNGSLLCPEMPLPSHATSRVRLLLSQQPIWTKRAVAMVHAGRAGSITPIHFDWDHTWVAHACLVGRKRFLLFPPNAGWLLNPVLNTSALAIPRFIASDRSELLNKLGGIEIELQAGQGIIFPSTFWHGALYDVSSLAVSVRWEIHAGGRPFAVLPVSWLLQRLVWRFFKDGYVGASNFMREYLKTFFRHTRTWRARYEQIADLCHRTLVELGESQGAAAWMTHNFSSELALSSRELKQYYDNVNATDLEDNTRVIEARRYIFDGVSDISRAQQLRLSRYALRVLQGLPPKRGLIKIEQE